MNIKNLLALSSIFCTVSLSGGCMLDEGRDFDEDDRGSGRDYVVSPNGSGSSCTIGSPCSMSTAIDKAGSDDHVVFLNGEYGKVKSKRSGVTFRAKNRRKATINGNGKNGMTIKHSNTTIRGLVITTNKKGSSAGISVDTDVNNILIEDNHVKETGQAGIKIGRAHWKRIDNVIIRNNLVEDTGFKGNGEAIYLGDATRFVGTDAELTNAQVYGNVLRRFTQNGIDLKDNVIGADIHHNLMEDQFYRPIDKKPANEGTMAVNGRDNLVHDNLMRNIDEASFGVFYAIEDGGNRMFDNVAMNVKAKHSLKYPKRRHKTGGPSIIEDNLFCNLSETDYKTPDVIIVRDNPGINGAQKNCNGRANEILDEMDGVDSGGDDGGGDDGGGGDDALTDSSTKVKASGQGSGESGPSNTLDGDLGTRWSSEGSGEWIRYDLGSKKKVKKVDIAWYKGDQRKAHFRVEVSDSKSGPWTTVFDGEAKGKSVDHQSFDVDDKKGRYVRIVGDGNNSNNWNSITEVVIRGS